MELFHCFFVSLSHVGIFIDEEKDTLVWEQNVMFVLVTKKRAYKYLVFQRGLPPPRWWVNSLWKFVDVIVNLECIHLYILCIVPRFLFWEVFVM